MINASQVYKRKIVTATRGDFLFEVVERIRDEGVGCAVVVDEPFGLPRRPVAVLTEQDIVVRATRERRGLRPLRVADIALPLVQRTLTTDSVSEVLRHMRAARVRYVPVVDERGIMQGVIGFDDILVVLYANAPDVSALLTPERAARRFAATPTEHALMQHRYDPDRR